MSVSKVNKLRIGLVCVALVLLGKLFYIQIIDDSYKTNAWSTMSSILPEA